MTVPVIGTGRAVEVLHDRGPARGENRWTGGSGYLIGSGLVLTVAHNIDYRRGLGGDEQLLVRTIDGMVLAARVVLAGEEMSRADLALLEISDPRLGEDLPLVTFARVDRDSPVPVTGCWAVGFPRFGEAGPVLPGGSRRETWQVSGHILPGGLRRAGLLSLQVTSTPRALPASLAGSEWEGMSGAVVFAADDRDGEQAAIGVISAHHPPEGGSALTVVPVTAVTDLAAAAQWWQQLGVGGPAALPVVPRPRAGAGPGGDRVPSAAALRAVLSVSAAEVSLAAGQDRLAQPPAGLRRSTADAVGELAWRWAHPDPAAAPGAGDAALVEAGRRLSEDYLAGPVGAALAARVGQAAGLNQVLELGLEVADQALGDLPWEALLVPGASGEIAEASPLVLHRNVALYRLVSGPTAGQARQVRGPLRLLVAIASPETGGAELLDYEAELARIVAAVEPARKRGQAYVRVLNEGSLEAINAALREDPEGFHVLHLSCHARPGELVLETVGGRPDPVSAGRLLEEGVPAGAGLPMVVLSGCSTGLVARQARLHLDAAAAAGHAPAGDLLVKEHGEEGEAVLASFAAQLVNAGVPQVLAMQAPVTDRYATMLGGEFYRRLATGASPDPLLVLAEARRAAERERLALPPDAPLRRRAEWATPALTAHALRVPLFSRSEPPGPVRPPQDPVLAEGVVVREVGDFVGRRAEMRQARRTLAGQQAGLVLHGIGGVGKSTLAAEVLRSLGGDAGLVVSRAGQLSVDDVLGEVGARVHLAAPAAEDGDRLARAGLQLRAADVEWADRWRLLAEQILPGLPVTVLLDNFEDNLQEAEDGGWQVRDPELAALLAGWARRPGLSRLVFTCRYPFSLPGRAERRLAGLHLGPLSAAETSKLMWRLPGLDSLPPEGRDRAYRNVGGHPRTLEYLDALLRGGQARFEDVAERMEDRLRVRGITDPAAWLAGPGRDLDASLAEAVTLSVDDVVLADLLEHLSATPVATELVTGASVYRVPVDDTALVFQVGQPAQRPPDPDRRARIRRVQQAIQEAIDRADGDQISLEDTGLTAEEYASYEADVAEELRPPVEAPAGLAAAVAAARAAGLLVPVPRGDQDPAHFVHRWTAGAITALHPDATREAHRRAAAFWRWRVDTIPQSREQDVDQLLEARYHHHAAGDTDQALAAHNKAVNQLQTWGQYGRAAELCRETLTWLTPGSRDAAATEQMLGTLAQARGDYDAAEPLYRRALEISERIGNQASMAAGYQNLGTLAQARGDYDAAEPLYRRSLEIWERIGNQAGVASGYGQLAMLAELRGDYAAAEPLYRRSLEISERIGDQEGMASGYQNLGILTQRRGDYAAAEPLVRRSLEIKERIGNQEGISLSYGQLGRLAQLRGDYDAAEPLYRRSLEISERIGDQARAARSYHNLGILAQVRRDYDAAEPLYRRSLEIKERIGDQEGMSTSYHQLGTVAQDRGRLDEAEPLYRRSLEISERIGNQAGMASSYGALGILAQVRGDYDAAEPLYRRSLEISERIGNQEGMSTSYHQLGAVAQDRGRLDEAEPLYRRSLEISERIGNQAGAAASYSALGSLSEAFGNLDEAVAYRVGAFAIRLRIGTATTGHLQEFAKLRHRLGSDRFRAAALAFGLDEESVGNLIEMLDQQEKTTGD